jgi:hypothetical protein
MPGALSPSSIHGGSHYFEVLDLANFYNSAATRIPNPPLFLKNMMLPSSWFLVSSVDCHSWCCGNRQW